jgi:transposase
MARYRTESGQKIMELFRAGIARREIAKIVGCSVSNVNQVVQTHSGWRGMILPLSEEHSEWLKVEAERHTVTIPELVRGMLTDAIAEAIEEDKGKANVRTTHHGRSRNT